MPKWLKVVLVVLAALAVVCCLGSAGVYWYLDTHKEELKGAATTAVGEGRAFGHGAGNDADACVDEALRRLQTRRGLVDQATNQMFLKACLEVAPRPDGFCRDVPASGEVVAIATWAVERCAAKSAGKDQDCARLMQVVQRACAAQ